MEIYNKIRSYILEEKFEIKLGAHYINIVNYIKIIKIESKEIVIEIPSKIIRIIGNNLAIQKLLRDEILITGNIYKLDLGSDPIA